MHQLLRVPSHENHGSPFLIPHAAYFLLRAPLLAIGSLDHQGRPWTSLWGGSRGFAHDAGQSTIEIESGVDAANDPVVEALLRHGAIGDGEVQAARGRHVFGGLAIDLASRSRLKLAGTVVAGGLSRDCGRGKSRAGHLRLMMKVEESLGNCPKYINVKTIRPANPTPVPISRGLPLPQRAIDLLDKADMFFVSSSNRQRDMDTNHRGGSPGFVRVIRNEADDVQLIWPEYSGNRLYQTLGNLTCTPKAGLCFPDYSTGDVLYLTGDTTILIGGDAANYLPGAKLAVKVQVVDASFVQASLAFRGDTGERSPYNPRPQYLSTERPTITSGTEAGAKDALLVRKDLITPTTARFRFRLTGPASSPPWRAGQYVAFSFENELSTGWSHMRDDDPKSLNDDYLRTFTVSSPPAAKGLAPEEFEITIRNVGVVTGFLFRQEARMALTIPLRGFGGEFTIEQERGQLVCFIAGGIGITPLLASFPSLDPSKLRVIWSMHVDDLDLALDSFARCPGLGEVTKLFLTGESTASVEAQRSKLGRISSFGTGWQRRRMQQADLQADEYSAVETWYLCASPALKRSTEDWLSGRRVISESFEY